MKWLNIMQNRIGIAVITYNARHLLETSLPPLLNSSIPARVLVVNSSSQDGTVELAQKLGAETLIVPRASFNHGSTREEARKYLGTDIVVMTTPDAIAVDRFVVEKLVEPLLQNKAALAYARQLPHDGADLFEAFPREFNYPAQSHIRTLKDIQEHGSYTFFFSDSFSAYQNSALDLIGGFAPVLTGEDTVALAKLLHKGLSVAYVAEAEVKHSHRYTLLQEFKRYFDTGLARKTYQDLISVAGSDDARGMQFTKALLQKITEECPTKLPYAVLQTAAKWLGYKIGAHSRSAPLWFKKRLSSQDFYWNSTAYLG